MCGIFGAIGYPVALDVERVRRELAHRGPDSFGYWRDAEAQLCHTRLKVMDLSDDAAQPMANEDGTVHLVFNGEIYNHRELRAELEAKGHRFRSRSDTEVIVHLYEESGEECLGRLWGMFGLAIWDSRRRRLLLARDRVGKKPLYYTADGPLAFSSELRPLLSLAHVARAPDEQALALFWLQRCIPAPYTAFRALRKLRPGHCLVWEDGRRRISSYWREDAAAPFLGDAREAADQLRGLVLDATRRRLAADVPLALCLSGGIDSAVVAWAAREAGAKDLLCLTVRPAPGAGSSRDEGALAARTARRLGLRHEWLFASPRFEECFDTLVLHHGEPFADPSMIPSYHLFEAVRRRAVVALSGDGGDEQFCGYPKYSRIPAMMGAAQLLPAPVTRFGMACLDAAGSISPRLCSALKAPNIACEILSYGRDNVYGAYALTETRRCRRRVFPGRRAAALLEEPLAFSRSLTAPYRRERLPKRLMLADQHNYLVDDVLCKVDIASMSHAVEVRSPLLDHRVVEFSRSLPIGLIRLGGRAKGLLRRAFPEAFDREVLHARKMGFGLPIREALRGEAAGWVRDKLLGPNEVFARYASPPGVARVVGEHLEGRANHTSLLFKLLALRRWIELLGVS